VPSRGRDFTDEKTYRAGNVLSWAFWQLIYMDLKAEGWLSGDVEVTVTLKAPPHVWGRE
jgi:hypothetical protein